ncbi:hypothetical protein DSO57_1020712 [Entomophthora muscae]|uniref:Uncharacterized protein n=1 Tax=Entomophthora muscae TaxID=34485 RepID=A0ACC2TEP8_9FUNG|nr:hypothetical protein DSO57_1020712 [Entomophthora muscae]
MKEILFTPLLNVPPAQDFSKLGFVYITVLGLTNQVVPHTGSWYLLATAVNYIVRIAPIVYMAFQAQPASPVGVQLGSGMGCDTTSHPRKPFMPVHSNQPNCILPDTQSLTSFCFAGCSLLQSCKTLLHHQAVQGSRITVLTHNSMKNLLLMWVFCLLLGSCWANVNFRSPEPTPTDKSEGSIWNCFGPHYRHALYVEIARFPPIVHPQAPWLVLGYTSVYHLLNHFTLFLGKFQLLGHLLHMLMVGIPVGTTLVKFNLGALLHSIGGKLPNEWIPDNYER